jgi:hypothetical protein
VCKLNGADLKFLNQANSESREAMKRSKNVASVPGKFNGTNALRFEIEERIREKRFGGHFHLIISPLFLLHIIRSSRLI